MGYCLDLFYDLKKLNQSVSNINSEIVAPGALPEKGVAAQGTADIVGTHSFAIGF